MTLTVTAYNGVPSVEILPVIIDTPDADFVGSPTEGSMPLMVDFTNLSTGQIDTYIWSFGDGDSAFIANPTHTYYDTGWFDVSLYISGPMGEDLELKVGYIHADVSEDNCWLSQNVSGDPILTQLDIGLEQDPTFHFILSNGSDTAHSVTFPLCYDRNLLGLLSLDIDTSTFPGSDLGLWNFSERDTVINDSGMVILYAWTSSYEYGLPLGQSHLGSMTFDAIDTGGCVIDTCYYPPDHHLNYSYGPLGRDYIPSWYAVDLTVLEAVCGDANGNGDISSADGFHILNFLGGVGTLSSCWAANVTGDEFLTMSDGFWLLNYFAGGPGLNCAPCSIQRP
jgi:PKD repeat protein